MPATCWRCSDLSGAGQASGGRSSTAIGSFSTIGSPARASCAADPAAPAHRRPRPPNEPDRQDADRARPIAELEADFAVGKRPTPDGRPWADLAESERRRIIDDHRLAYVSEAPVNWCPGLGTVLANEEVTADGRSERGNFPVFKRNLRQWMMRITAYADRLVDDLDRIEWPDKVKIMQRNWIGRSTGANIRFATDAGDLEVFTTRPDALFGATFMVVAPEHPLVEALTTDAWPEGAKDAWTGGAATPSEAIAAYRQQAANRTEVERQTEGREKTGVFTGSYAVNPATGERIPVFVADYVLMGYGTGAIMAVPGQDERDWEYAEKFDLPIVRTVQPPADWTGEAYTGEGPAINSAKAEGSLNGVGVDEAKAAADGQPAIGITDHGNMYGTLEFYKECREHGLKPIIGTEAYMAHEHRSERPARRGRS